MKLDITRCWKKYSIHFFLRSLADWNQTSEMFYCSVHVSFGIFRTKRHCSVSVTVTRYCLQRIKIKIYWNIMKCLFCFWRKAHDENSRYRKYNNTVKILNLDLFNMHCFKMFSADLCDLVIASQTGRHVKILSNSILFTVMKRNFDQFK